METISGVVVEILIDDLGDTLVETTVYLSGVATHYRGWLDPFGSVSDGLAGVTNFVRMHKSYGDGATAEAAYATWVGPMTLPHKQAKD